MKPIKYSRFGEAGMLLDFGNEINKGLNKHIHQIANWLNKNPFPGFIETVSAYTTLTVLYDPMMFIHPKKSAYELAKKLVQERIDSLPEENILSGRVVSIPVCYGGEFGPDLENVASHNQLTEKEVISIHTANSYYIYMLGFAPGFPFLGGMSKEIAAPRLSSPRLAIPKGSVGIAGEQTGIYPIETPGGWQLIGRTPLKLFTPHENPPTLLQAGDQVKFFEISEEEFLNWEVNHGHNG